MFNEQFNKAYQQKSKENLVQAHDAQIHSDLYRSTKFSLLHPKIDL